MKKLILITLLSGCTTALDSRVTSLEDRMDKLSVGFRQVAALEDARYEELKAKLPAEVKSKK
jgi:hypothetical protein